MTKLLFGLRHSSFLPTSSFVLRHFLLVIEQPFLSPQTAAVTTERAISANDTMTRNHDTNHIRAVRATDSAACVLISELLRHPRIGTRFAYRNRTQNFPGSQLKVRADRRQRNVELQVLAG